MEGELDPLGLPIPEDAAEQIAAGERIDAETPLFDIAGANVGGKRVLATINFVAVDPRGKEIDLKTAMDLATKHLYAHCEQIKWWPSGEYPDVVVKKRDDGNWFGVAFLKEGGHGSKDWGDFPHIDVDDRTSDDVKREELARKQR